MKIKTEDLQDAFEICNRVPQVAGNDSSQFIRLQKVGKDLTLSLTGLLKAEASFKSDSEGKWTTFIDRRVLQAFLRTTKTPEIEVFYKDNVLVFKASARLEVAAHAPISGYETWKPSKAIDLTDEEKEVIRMGMRFLPNFAGAAHVEALYFGASWGVLATDTLYMMAVLGHPVKDDFYLPAAIAPSVLSSGKLALDKQGVGALFDKGFVYQPLSAELSRFPLPDLKDIINDGLKVPAIGTFSASDLCALLTTATHFIFEKLDQAKIKLEKNAFQVTVESPIGKFQQSIPMKVLKSQDIPDWTIKKIIPWLEFAVSLDPAIEITFARRDNSGVLRFVHNKQKHILILADL